MKKTRCLFLVFLVLLVYPIIIFALGSMYNYPILNLYQKKETTLSTSNDNYTNDPLLSQQWGVFTVGANIAFENGINGTNASYPSNPVVVAILDTGVDYTHEDLAANYLEGGKDYVNGDNDPMDDNGHGTHCAGIIAALANNGKGICGVAPCAKILAFKVLDAEGYGDPNNVSQAINDIVNYYNPKSNITHGVDIISMSFGSFIPDSGIQSAIAAAVAAGIICVASAGNMDFEWVFYPASDSNVIAISAITVFQKRASYSSYGNQIEYAAPGGDIEMGFLNVGILSTMPGNKYERHYGTSMAAPMAAGVIALLLGNGTTPSNLRTELNALAKNLGDPGWDKYYGNGLIRVADNNWDYSAWFHRNFDDDIVSFWITVYISLNLDKFLKPPLFNITNIAIIATLGTIAVVTIVAIASTRSKSKRY